MDLKKLGVGAGGYVDENLCAGHQTPITHRKPLQVINWNAPALSPTKRRKQNHIEGVAELVKAIGTEDCSWSPSRVEERHPGTMMYEVFCWLGVRDLIERAAPACKPWRDIAHGKELWMTLRPRVRLLDQLLVSEKIVERRSKGRLFRGKRLGTGEPALLRIVDLELTNAGKDDGVPTSFLREAALLSRLQHPNVIRHFGVDVLGKRVAMCTEFVHESFTAWFKRLEGRRASDRLVEIRTKFRQVLSGLSHVHHQGVMHRNLKPDNIFIDEQGIVKLGDFTTTRMLDIPLQPYTPEDPKERDRSGREMRRLWYRAPELILRDEVYGPKVDTWSVGCLLAEAAFGKVLFQSDSEIDHLFRVFRLIGTPSPSSWPALLGMKGFSPKFPVYAGFNFAQVSRAASCGSSVDQDALLRQGGIDRSEVVRNLLGVASVLGPEGMYALSRMVIVPPESRAGADDMLASPFFDTHFGALLREEGAELPASTSSWLRGESTVGRELFATAPVEQDAFTLSRLEDDKRLISPGMISNTMAWSILRAMQEKEQEEKQKRRPGVSGTSDPSLPRLPAGLTAGHRATLMDFLVTMASTLNLTDYALHLAAAIADRYIALQDDHFEVRRLQVVGAACLKIADVFAEQSKEYYKQENVVEYAEAMLLAAGAGQVASPEQVLSCEKDVLPELGFDLHLPTTHWFLQCYLALGGLPRSGHVAKTAFFICDLTLLDRDILRYVVPMRAQATMVLAAFFVQETRQKAETQRPAKDQGVPVAQRQRRGAPLPSLESLRRWDSLGREQACVGNNAVDAAMCLQALLRIMLEMRREWKSTKLLAVEARHDGVARTLVYPDRFPTAQLVRFIVPDCQLSSMPSS